MAEDDHNPHVAEQTPATTHGHPRAHSEAETTAGTGSSHGISINVPDDGSTIRSSPVKQMSAPAMSARHSPIRHHKRVPSRGKAVKETLNARSHYGSSDDDGSAVHRINQYIIKQEIGRGSFGAVHLAHDQFGAEYAVKEFSKSRLRKRAQSNLLRKPNQQRRPGHLAAGLGFNSPLHRQSSSEKVGTENNSLSLIKEEIAIMKKLNHNNLVNLIEVLDDPQEDSLYMVLEMCKKGVVMKVGLDERAAPYEDEACRCWFRDMILGIEYLHTQGIIHRDIKPDNCLITNGDVLKIVDFGVSEMFEKDSDMATAKSAGSPAFMPPELCVARHGTVNGKAADIWSMGVTLYCLRYGHIPFEKGGMLELYDSIRGDELQLEDERDDNFKDLMVRMLEKDPEKRIAMSHIRSHPWVTQDGEDPLLSAEDNCADLVEPPTEAEMDNAITGNMASLMVVMRAVKRFKRLLHRKRPSSFQGLFGRESKLVAPPAAMRGSGSKSTDPHDRKPMDATLVTAGEIRDAEADDKTNKLLHDPDQAHEDDAEVNAGSQPQLRRYETEAVRRQREETARHHPHHGTDPALHRQTTTGGAATTSHPSMPRSFTVDDHEKGHAHDPLEDTLYLSIGANADQDPDQDRDSTRQQIVSESPPEVEMNIYEHAYQEEINRIMSQRGAENASMYLNRRVEHREDLRSHSNILDSSKEVASEAANRLAAGLVAGKNRLTGRSGGGGLAALVKQAKEQNEEDSSKKSSEDSEYPPLLTPKFAGAGAERDESKEDETAPVIPESIVKAQAHLDVAKGAMPGMPGAFPASPGRVPEKSAVGKE
ncbi:hypothetical protein LTR78_006531 [Recurvomyces mirabilis]|uniref:Protein kinase domain-containing protein n=1 Tax=Recurvomyces mirabilis TaxID=574656 RepID=A0AAE1BZV3_9PEZI|nr:hypothetical protein LTR78_006531 [Recurvomyces mirabilis]KAK5151051.1 hypothetical protein LTS14_009546 [Recurvomyces mirabilis]